jgi:hypothetical protein
LPGRPPSDSQTSEQTKTEQYTLSHERYEKAVAYSRAGYTLYFVSYFLSVVLLFLILRFGLAAKFRDIAEIVSDRRWIQGLVFVPLLFLTLDILSLPLSTYWHLLSLRYEQSIQGGFLAVGLEREFIGLRSNRAGLDPVCCHAVQPAAGGCSSGFPRSC